MTNNGGLVAGFDPGAHCGFALLSLDGYRITSGTWRLGKRCGEGIQNFENLVESLLSEGAIAVGYEKVRSHRGVEASHAYGSYEAIIWKACFNAGLPTTAIYQISVQEAKRLATNMGDADKLEMEAAAMSHWAYIPDDDNEADSLWIAECTRRRLVSVP